MHARHFGRKTDAQRWLDEVTASTLAGTYVSPRTARTTVSEWCETWLAGYATRRPSTVRQARVHVAQITAEFGDMPLAAVRPSHVRSWTSRLRDENLSVSYVYALHSRLAQIMADAVHDGIVPRSPCSRRTSPGPAASVPTWPPRSRCGRCTTRCLNGYASAKTTLDTYGHLWPDRDESTRAAVDAVLATRVASPADSVRTSGPANDSRRRSDGT